MNERDLTHVPGRSHYAQNYFRGGRIFSYAHQIDTVLSFEPRTVLEVGAGGGMVTAALRSVGLEVTTADVQPDLDPDVVASVTDLPFSDGQFDVALCCQVLEHLPFDQFRTALCELKRVTRRGMVMSLPDITRVVFVSAKLPKMKQFRFAWSIPRRKLSRTPNVAFERDGHYWEIGFPSCHLARVSDAIESSQWNIRRSWRVPELPWHRFFLLDH